MCFRKTIHEGEPLNLCIAECDIIVYKKLYWEHSNGWRTPYQRQTITFHDGIAVQEQKELQGWVQDYNLFYYEGEIEPHKTFSFVQRESVENGNVLEIYQGIHSCETFIKASLQGVWSFWDTRAVHAVFLCVIPKGARYLQEDFGGNYVSDKLIIFENDKAYEQYKRSSTTVD